MNRWFGPLDQILRGEATRLPDLMRKEFHVPVGRLTVVITVLAAVYGMCMGSSAVVARWGTDTRNMGYEQIMASMIKVPLLFFLTLLVTFPSLYVFNALVGSRLGMLALLRLLIAALAVMIAVLASFGPIAAFFALSTTSYPFMIVLHTIIFSVAGFLGLAFLLRTLQRLTLASIMKEQEADSKATSELSVAGPTAPGGPGALEELEPIPQSVTGSMPPAVPPPPLGRFPNPAPVRSGALERVAGHSPTAQVARVFRVWIIVFALVGAQMAWILRPFVGDPSKPFEFFRPRHSNFFAALLEHVLRLFDVNWR